LWGSRQAVCKRGDLNACGCLLLARAARRAREIAIRSSLGATRWRIVRQLLIESLVLAGGAGIAGYAFSVAGVRLFAIIFAVREVGGTAATMPYWLNLSADGRVLAFLAGVCLVSTLLFGLAPALHVSKTNIADVLKDGGRGAAGPRHSRRWTAALLVAELALTLVLLAGTGLLVRSFVALYRAVGAVDSRDVVTARIALPAQKYATPSARLAFFDQFTDRLGADSAIDGVAVASELPFMLLRRFLVNTPARDPITLFAVALLLVVVALIASLLPARRAARIDPVLALRYE